MEQVVKLEDYKSEAFLYVRDMNNKRETESGHYYASRNIRKAIRELANNNLKYDIKTGKTYMNNECCCEYANEWDIPIYNDESDVVKYEFINFIMSSIGRLEREYNKV